MTKLSEVDKEVEELIATNGVYGAEVIISALYKIEGKEGVYCKNCADEFRIQSAIDSRK